MGRRFKPPSVIPLDTVVCVRGEFEANWLAAGCGRPVPVLTSYFCPPITSLRHAVLCFVWCFFSSCPILTALSAPPTPTPARLILRCVQMLWFKKNGVSFIHYTLCKSLKQVWSPALTIPRSEYSNVQMAELPYAASQGMLVKSCCVSQRYGQREARKNFL